jgi:hypothetical protein
MITFLIWGGKLTMTVWRIVRKSSIVGLWALVQVLGASVFSVEASQKMWMQRIITPQPVDPFSRLLRLGLCKQLMEIRQFHVIDMR